MKPPDIETEKVAARVGERSHPRAVLIHRNGSTVIRFRDTPEFTVGRAAPADVIIDEPSLSRAHAAFALTPAGIVVKDLGSRNGTLVRGKNVTEARVYPGDEVTLGEVVVLVDHDAGSALERTPLASFEDVRRELAREVARARTFGRTHAVVLLKAHGTKGHIKHWAQAVTAQLRQVDTAAVYAPETLLVSLGEADASAAVAFAERVRVSQPELVASVAVFPQDAANEEELISVAAESIFDTSPTKPVARATPAPRSLVVSESAVMREVKSLVARVAPSALSILVLGETGTGKELIARHVHEESPRVAGPFRAVNCAAIPATLLEGILFGHERGAFTGADKAARGVFEQAHGGTVFLDEVGELSAAAQGALLRVLETRRVLRVGGEREIDVDVRLVAATHRDLDAMVEAGQFRRDLLFRLDGVTLRLPPLRERGAEIVALARQFLVVACAANGRDGLSFSSEVMSLFERYAWPGNVRELKNAVERAVVVARTAVIEPADLPDRVRIPVVAQRPSAARSDTLLAAAPAVVDTDIDLESDVADDDAELDVSNEEGDDESGAARDFRDRVRENSKKYERELIVAALRKHLGSRTKAAEELGLPVRTLAHKMRELGIRLRD